MNILPFVLAILIVLSYGASVSFQSRMASRRNQKAHVGMRSAEMQILRQSEWELYDHLPGEPVKVEKMKHDAPPKEEKKEVINPSCAKLNLFPLIDQGKMALPALYETAAKMLRLFYRNTLFENQALEYRLLDAILAAGKRSLNESLSLPIETLDLKNGDLQALYYTALKGTKKCQLSEKGYPSLLDYLKIDRMVAPICLFDAHPHILTLFFGPKTASIVHREIHSGQKQSLELETILQLSSDPDLAFVNPDVWKLIDFHRPTHGSSSRLTMIGEDAETGICVRRDFQVK
jgi:hypothetical protein